MKAMRVAQQALVASAVAAILAGCSSVPLDDKKTPVETRTPTAVTPGAGAGAGGTSQSQVTSVDLTKNANAAQSNLPRVVYFDFDSFVVKDEFRPTIDAHAKVLGADRKKKLAIEGHTDERGGREYNLALGQKRAEAVAKSRRPGRAARGGELRQGAAGCTGQRRSRLGQEPPRRVDLPLSVRP
jgi:peptidoglycan-associated lipoprotein